MRIFTFLILAFLLSRSVNSDRAREANRAYEAGDFEQAENLYREILQNTPDSPQILFNLGNALARQEKYDESAEAFERYRNQITDPSKRAPAEYNLGHLHGETGNTKEALKHFRQALDLNPDDEDAKFNYELLKRRQQQTPPDEDPDNQEEEEQQPESGEAPPSPEGDQQQNDGEGQETPPASGQPPPGEEEQRDTQPKPGQEQLEHARDIMNALEQIEKDLIKDFKKRQNKPQDPHEKDW